MASTKTTRRSCLYDATWSATNARSSDSLAVWSGLKTT
jgi:hypothetical protein